MKGVRTSIPEETYSFEIFQGWLGPTAPPLNLNPRVIMDIKKLTYLRVYFAFKHSLMSYSNRRLTCSIRRTKNKGMLVFLQVLGVAIQEEWQHIHLQYVRQVLCSGCCTWRSHPILT